jgi:hypothetical protein
MDDEIEQIVDAVDEMDLTTQPLYEDSETGQQMTKEDAIENGYQIDETDDDVLSETTPSESSEATTFSQSSGRTDISNTTTYGSFTRTPNKKSKQKVDFISPTSHKRFEATRGLINITAVIEDLLLKGGKKAHFGMAIREMLKVENTQNNTQKNNTPNNTPNNT